MEEEIFVIENNEETKISTLNEKIKSNKKLLSLDVKINENDFYIEKEDEKSIENEDINNKEIKNNEEKEIKNNE